MKQQNRLLQLKVHRLTAKLDAILEKQGVELDDVTSSDLTQIVTEEEQAVYSAFPPGSFQRIFWEQQKDCLSRVGKGMKGMRWHPLMIKWCIYLRHLSSKSYELLRESGVVCLPSQRTLRDYTNCVKANPGFSHDVDTQLLRAVNAESCPAWHKLVILLLDEMHIKEGLVYDKHTGRMIGFVELGDINNHLLDFEKYVENESTETMPLASSVMVMMLKGLFTPFRYPYAHFPCASITGDLLFQPFWEAVYHLERMEFKVSLSVEVNVIYIFAYYRSWELHLMELL